MKLVDWLLRRDRDADLEAEIRAHPSMAAQERIGGGEDPRVARLRALKEFGNVTRTREATRLSWGGAWRSRIADVAQDFRYAIRTLGHSPGSSLVVVTVLALGIGANVAVVFGVIAMILTALGTYGLVSYAARQSTHEIGIRIAIGASRAQVLRRFLGRGLWLGAAGAVSGLAGSALLTWLLAGLLYGVSPTDAVSFAGAAAAVLATVLVASLIPAWLASRTDPINALRHP